MSFWEKTLRFSGRTSLWKQLYWVVFLVKIALEGKQFRGKNYYLLYRGNTFRGKDYFMAKHFVRGKIL